MYRYAADTGSNKVAPLVDGNENTKEQDKELLSYLSSLVKKDSLKTNVIDMTPLGLVEVTRKKVHKSLKEQLGVRSNS